MAEHPSSGGARGGERVPVERGGPGAARGCRLCAAGLVRAGTTAPEAPAGGDGTATVAYCDDDLLALVEHGSPGVLVAPRAHVDGLETSPTRGAPVLGALRRAASAVASSYVADGTAIEATIGLPGAPGHICYRVVPTLGDRPIPPGTASDVDPDVLALALGRSPEPGPAAHG